ncbi:MAG: 8-oxo-dGTP diphosphatase [Anaerolineales bacterium]|nr:8-oxo-dGTP diphosphatase [Anaerolineales bacterium]
MKLATLCYLRHENKTLMVHRIKKENDIHQGKWNGLGGKIEQGETPEECVIREVYEESGLHIHNPLLRGVLTFPKFADDEDWYAFVFVANEFEGELIDSPEGDLRWVPNEKIFELPMWEGDRLFLPWLDEKRFFSGKFVYQDGKLVEHSVVFHEPPQNQR